MSQIYMSELEAVKRSNAPPPIFDFFKGNYKQFILTLVVLLGMATPFWGVSVNGKTAGAVEYYTRVSVERFGRAFSSHTTQRILGCRKFDGNALLDQDYSIERVDPFLDYVMSAPETRHNLMPLGQVGALAASDSGETQFSLSVADDTTENQFRQSLIPVNKVEFVNSPDIFHPYTNQLSVDSLFSILSELYTATNGDKWSYEHCPSNSQWDITRVPPSVGSLERWCGLTFTNGLLTKLDLRNFNLNGPIPPELGNLVNLTLLNLAENQLTGPIPLELSNLENLRELNLYKTQFLTGPIPPELGNIEHLRALALVGNQLTGPIPPELGSLEYLDYLDLSNNRLTGSIPVKFVNSENFYYLDLAHNQLTGPIPPELGNMEHLHVLSLAYNQLTGPIPPELGNMDSLQRLLLAGNQLTGPIPSELGNLDNLERLSLRSNPFTSGPIPPELFNLRNLKVLNLSHSQLTGKIPPELGNLTNLEFLSLTENQLSGPIPPELGRLRKLRSLVLRSNQLTGEIPPELGNLLNLNYLNLQGNALSGTIPPELGQLVNIGANTSTLFDVTPDQIHGRFDVSKNKLTGALPQSFVHFNHLDYLNFESNSGLCAPSNDEFQMWLDTIETVTGDTCSEVSFSEGIANQSYPRSLPIPPLILPESITGVLPIVYTWNVLELPFGLRYDPVTRTVSGAPTHVTPPVLFTYKATDAIGSKDSLQFSIEVYSAVAIERGVLPEKFELRTNYPNPFQHSTNIAFNLPWPAQIQIEVMDVIGRRMMSSIPVNMEAGWEQKIEVNRESLSSGHYLYRLIVESPTDRSIHVGHFTLVR